MACITDHVKEFAFYFQGYGKSLICFNQQINKIRFIIYKDPFVMWRTVLRSVLCFENTLILTKWFV